VLTLVIASVAIFSLVRLIPGDPAVSLAGPDATDATLDAIRTQLGLHKPLVEQYFVWLGQLAHGNFGDSVSAGVPVTDVLLPTLVPTLWLLGGAVLVALVVGFALGIGASVPRRKGVDATLSGLASVLHGAPPFWIGLLALLFAVTFNVLPAGGFVSPIQDPALGLSSLVLPSVVLGLAMGGLFARFIRASYLEVLDSDYVRLAEAKGAGTWWIVRKHIFRNALVPIVTVFGVNFANLLGGAVVIESVFSWPGMGSLLMNAVNNQDYAVVQAMLLFFVTAFIVVNFLTDVSYTVIDPRIRLSGTSS
jgi:peptide/nickel transport system permease protein